jgi:hypothetical protein
MRRFFLPALLLPLSCTGTTGYQLVSFYAVAEGPPDARPGQPYVFTSDDARFRVSLTKAVIHVGAMYLDESLPTSGAGEGKCTLPGTYVGEVLAGRDVDMLDPEPQLFPITGRGSTIPAAVGQVWLSGPDVTDPNDLTVVLSVAGTATSLADGSAYPFTGDVTIDKSRNPAPASTALPGSNPICEQRIVTPILVDVTLSQGGTLVLRLDPKSLFTNVDFSRLHSTSVKTDPPSPPSFVFTNDDAYQPSRNLYANLRAAGAVYRFAWQPAKR